MQAAIVPEDSPSTPACHWTFPPPMPVNNPSPSGGRQGGGSIRVLIVDDQALVRAGFRMILDAQPDLEVVGEAADGSTSIDAVRTLRPDVVLLAIRMPRAHAIDAPPRR